MQLLAVFMRVEDQVSTLAKTNRASHNTIECLRGLLRDMDEAERVAEFAEAAAGAGAVNSLDM
jgi:hypothetical protein